jgi:homoserine dehydrogenase
MGRKAASGQRAANQADEKGNRKDMNIVRLSLAGFGGVGRGFVELLWRKQADLRQTFGLEARLVGIGNARHGFIYREEGLDLALLLALGSLTDYPQARQWPTCLAGLQETEADVLLEATPTNLRDAEPGFSHMVTAMRMGAHVVTANKGPGALAGLDLLLLARQLGVQVRMESCVMAGTPVLSTLREGMAGASIQSIRAILNGTTNFILSAMAGGRTYASALAEAQALGYAEADPTADVAGHDALAKTLILAALVFNQALRPEQVALEGIGALAFDDVQQAVAAGMRIKLLASLRREGSTLQASVSPQALPLDDPLARVEGVTNALTVQSDTLTEMTIIGPGAGALPTAQGLLADLIACVR